MKLNMYKPTLGVVNVCFSVKRIVVVKEMEELKAVLMSTFLLNIKLLDAFFRITSIQHFLKISKCSLLTGVALDLIIEHQYNCAHFNLHKILARYFENYL